MVSNYPTAFGRVGRGHCSTAADLGVCPAVLYKILMRRDGVVVGGDSANRGGGSEVDKRQLAIKTAAGVTPGDQVLETDQATLKSELQERALRAEGSVRARQSRVQFAFPPGGMDIERIRDG